jgi:hypothetical protein
VDLADPDRALLGLHVDEPSFKRQHHLARGGQPMVDRAANRTGEELIERRDVPPAVHVALTKADRASREDPVPGPLVVDLRVPGVRSVDLDAAGRERLGEERGRTASVSLEVGRLA